MLQRLYISNFKSFLNFELKPEGKHSSLLVGKNGAGKSSIAQALLIFQAIGRNVNRVGELVSTRDFFAGNSKMPMRLELEVEISGKNYRYLLALELPERFRELRVLQETLEFDGGVIYSREQAQVSLRKGTDEIFDSRFVVDWHVVALPLIQVGSPNDPISIFRTWLSRMVVISPIPQLMVEVGERESLWPKFSCENFVDWLDGLLGKYPSAYTAIYDYLKEVMPDLLDFHFEMVGKFGKELVVNFSADDKSLTLGFGDLSDGEKCFFLSSVIVAANKAYGPLLCFWDEPDNFLSLAEVGHFVMQLRRAFEQRGQIIMTTHNEEAIRKFSNENTWVIGRKSHLEPTQHRLLEEFNVRGDVVKSFILGELEI